MYFDTNSPAFSQMAHHLKALSYPQNLTADVLHLLFTEEAVVSAESVVAWFDNIGATFCSSFSFMFTTLQT